MDTTLFCSCWWCSCVICCLDRWGRWGFPLLCVRMSRNLCIRIDWHLCCSIGRTLFCSGWGGRVVIFYCEISRNYNSAWNMEYDYNLWNLVVSCLFLCGIRYRPSSGAGDLLMIVCTWAHASDGFEGVDIESEVLPLIEEGDLLFVDEVADVGRCLARVAGT